VGWSAGVRGKIVRLKLLEVCAALALLTLTFSGASALTLTETYTGIVTSGSDTSNLFGLNGASLVGQQYTATYTFDAGLGTGIVLCNGCGAGTEIVLQSNGNPNGSPLVIASLTINNASYSISGGNAGLTGFYPCQQFCGLGNPNYSTIEVSAGGDGVPNPNPQLFNYLSDHGVLNIPMSVALLSTNFTFSPLATNDQRGGLRINGADYVDFFNIASVSLDICDSCGFAPPVPEPSTWAMLLVGFAALGFAAYRRSLPRYQISV
jgi:hypothetical protein